MPTDPERSPLEQRFVRDLLASWAFERANLVISTLAKALLDRDMEAIAQQLGLENIRNTLAVLKAQIEASRDVGWEQVVSQLPASLRHAPGMDLSLSAMQVTDPAVGRLAAQLDLSRITAITADTRQALLDLIAQGWRDGTHPNVLAQQIKAAIGVNRPQAAALIKYRAKLTTEGRKADQVERMVTKKAAAYRTQRSQTIARTELARAQQEGARLQYQRMVTDGVIDPTAYVVQFLTAEDERVCPICGPLDGQQIAIGSTFVSTVGLMPGPPMHPNCRCVTRLLPHQTAPLYAPPRA